MDAVASQSAAVYLANSQKPLRSGSKRVRECVKRKIAESQKPQQSQQLQPQLLKLKQRPSTSQHFFGSDLSDSEDLEVEDITSVRKSFGFFYLDQNQNHFFIFHKSSYQNPI